MKTLAMFVTWLALAGIASAQGAKPIKKCPADSVVSGAVCMDKYEASVWRIPNATTSNKAIVQKVQQGKATVAALQAAGATQLGLGLKDDFAPCQDSGQNCANDVYAVSVAGVYPSEMVTWFQAQAACKNSRKRLPSNAEWQAAVTGTPDSGSDNGTTDCHVWLASGGPEVPTGSRSACVSSDGVYDMVGNALEIVADWVPRSTDCSGSWSAKVTADDYQCFVGTETTGEPGMITRGGDFSTGTPAGPLAIAAGSGPSVSFRMGFRCAR